MTSEILLHRYKGIYYSFPQPLKTFLGSLYGSIPLSIRFGRNFTLHEKLLRTFEEGDEQFKIDFMYNKTLETLLFAEKNIPYYKNIFQEYGISSKEFKSLDDMKLFPTLTKQDIKNNLDNIHIAEDAVAYYSGGSLSTPTKYFLPESSRAKEKAYNNFLFAKIGYKYRDRTLLLKGREVSDIEKKIFCEYEPVDNYMLLSNNYMNSSYFVQMYKKAKKFKPKFLFGYPSAILSFIKQSKLHNLEKIDIKGIILASETIYTDEIKIIQDYFGVSVLTHYGHTERNAMAYRIDEDNYKFMNSYGLTRVVENEIVTTTFDNFVMPFINYHTNDHVAGAVKYYRDCDVAKEVQNIDGRTQDFLVTDDERLVSITTMCGGQHLPLEQMDAIQYLQEEKGKVTVLVQSDELNENEVKKGMHKLVKEGVDFNVKMVDEIEKSSRGKRVMCKQTLNIEEIRKKSC